MMEMKLYINYTRVYSFVRWNIRVFLFLTFATRVGGAEFSSKLTEMEKNHVRPETTLLRFFAKSFAPESGVVSSDCQRDSDLYRNDLGNYEPWALQMYDASTKISAGIVTGNTKQLGNYDACLRVKSSHGFVGKACNAKLRFFIPNESTDRENLSDDLNMADLMRNLAKASGLTNWTSGDSAPYEWMWCVPSSCSPRDVIETIEVGLDPLKEGGSIDFAVYVDGESCHTEQTDRPIIDLADWLIISLLILLGSLVVLSTLYDLAKQRNPEKPDPRDTKHAILCSFSAYTNGKYLMNVRRGNGAIASIDGLRFLSICWIIFGHTYYLKIVGVGLDFLSVPTMHERWDAFLLLNGNIATDTFFLISGILLATAELGQQKKGFDRRQPNVFYLYIRRYLRLTPSYAIVIAFYATLFYKIGNGPLWNTWVGQNRDYCRENWWTNLLYINNYVNISRMCMTQSWYLSVDMQLVLISPIFLYPMLGKGKRNQWLFLAIMIIGFLASVLVPFLITYFNELTGTMLYYRNQKDVEKVYLQIYTKTYARAGPYLLGLGLGYLLKKVKPSNTSIPISFIVVGWILAAAASLAVTFGPREMYFPHHDYNVIEAAFYAGLHRSVFALAVGWIIFTSVFGFGGPVGAFLSWSIWAPLSKLSYSAYLCHYIILLYNSGTVRTPENVTSYTVVQAFLANLVITLIVAAILSLTVEIPFARLTNLCFPRNRRSSISSKQQPVVSSFQTSESIIEIYRSVNDAPASTVSGIYGNLNDRRDGTSAEMIQRPGWLDSVINPNVIGSNALHDSQGIHRGKGSLAKSK